ncbi:MAG: deoxynucleoside kinase [bacterium]|nr:deoxynucleoside kinase [bacterium]
MFIIIDGIDGSGKSTIINTWKEWLTTKSHKVFDLKKYLQEKNQYPTIEEVMPFDYIFSAEPTYTGVGKVIREEFIRTGTNYSNTTIAEAFSLDRLVSYNKMIIPLLTAGKCIIQDRSVTTSLIYHSTGENPISMEKMLRLTGNKLAVKNRPDHLILVKTDPEIAFSRISSRTDKNDNAIFERLSFMKKISAKFFSNEFQQIFSSRGSIIHHLNGNADFDTMKTESISLLKQILNQ